MIVGVGVDMEHVERFHQILARRPALIDQVFTDEERAVHGALPDPAPGFTSAFAVKEAVMKALGQAWLESALFWTDIELLSPPDALEPRVRLSGAAEARRQALGVGRLLVALEGRGPRIIAQVWLLSDDGAPPG